MTAQIDLFRQVAPAYGAVLRIRDGWAVRDCPHRKAVEMVERLHYARGMANTSVLRAGLFDPAGTMVGVSVWMPTTPGSQRWAEARGFRKPIMLSRMVIEDAVPKNAASFLLARACKLLRVMGWDLAVTWADPIEGHDGHVYTAAGWERVGSSISAARWVDRSGRMRSRIVGPKRLTVAECEGRGWSKVKGAPKPRFIRVL